MDAAIADYRGVDVASMAELRRSAQEHKVYLKVSRNKLIMRALEGTEYSCLQDELSGPTLIGFSLEEPGSVARLFRDFSKKNPEFEVKGLAINNEFLEPQKIGVLANLPTRDEALASLARTLQAPVQQFAVVLNQMPTGLVRVLAALQSSKN